MNDVKPLSVRLEADLLQRVNEYCQDNSIARSSFIRLAVTRFLDQVDQPTRVATLDSEARAAIDQLNARLMKVESELKQLKMPNTRTVQDSMFG